MSTDTASLPTFPLEVHGHILSFCDAPTLAVTSRVSLAFLELSGPLLYRDITIRGEDRLEKLIRSETVLSSVAPHVSLAQTRSLTFFPVRPSGAAEQGSALPSVAQPILQIETLVIDLREDGSALDQSQTRNFDDLLAWFDPSHVLWLADPGPEPYVNVKTGFRSPHLKKISFVNVSPDEYLISIARVRGRFPPVDIVIDLSVNDATLRMHEIILGDVSIDLGRRAGPGPPAFGTVQVWVGNEEKLALAKAILVGLSCTSLDIGVKQPAVV